MCVCVGGGGGGVCVGVTLEAASRKAYSAWSIPADLITALCQGQHQAIFKLDMLLQPACTTFGANTAGVSMFFLHCMHP